MIELRLKVCLSAVLPVVIAAAFISGCALPATDEYVYSGDRPAIGLSVENEAVTEVDVREQTRLNITAANGSIKITRSENGKLQIRERIKLTGPASKDELKKLPDYKKSDVETTFLSINVNTGQTAELKPLFGIRNDIELAVPASLTNIGIKAANAKIELSGFDGMSAVELSAKKGAIIINDCVSKNVKAAIESGDVKMSDITGSIIISSGRGDVSLSGIKGSTGLKLVSGGLNVESFVGRINCDISSGNINISSSEIEGGSVLYASRGDISADLEGLSAEGKLTVKTSAGNIRLEMPEDIGWSLIAKSSAGRVVNSMKPAPETLKRAPSGEVYGDVKGGGPTIDVYSDMGDIVLDW